MTLRHPRGGGTYWLLAVEQLRTGSARLTRGPMPHLFRDTHRLELLMELVRKRSLVWAPLDWDPLARGRSAIADLVLAGVIYP